jgi:hypothetical protein
LLNSRAWEERDKEVRLRREGRTAADRAARDRVWRERLATALAPGLAGAERIRRVADALASKGWKIQVRDLTPELETLADEYLTALARWKNGQPISAGEKWLMDTYRRVRKPARDNPAVVGLGAISGGGPNIDHLRVGALNNLVKNFKSDAASSSAEPSSPARGPRLLRG